MDNSLKKINEIITKKYSIVDVIKNYLSLTKKGKDYKALCPFHGDNDPSLSISPTLNVFTCFSCNTKGNAITFVMKYKNLSYIEAVKEIVKILDINDDEIKMLLSNQTNFNRENEELYEINEKAMFIYHRTLLNSENSTKLDYLVNERKISQKIIDEYQIGYSQINENKNYLQKTLQEINPNEYRPALLNKSGLVFLNNKDEYCDFFYDRIIIPIKNENGRVVGFSGRTTNKNEKIKYINTKSTDIFKKEEILFNYYNFDKSKFDEIIIVEGYMDVFAFKKLGINNVVATMGTSFTNYHVNLIKKYPNITTIILCFDNDNAGMEATKKTAEKIIRNSKLNVFVVKPFFKEYKDVDEIVFNFDENEARNIITNQVSYVQYLVCKLLDNDIDYKNKKIQTSKILDIINDYAYNPLFIKDDLDLLSKFSGIDVNELNSLINQRKVFNKNNKFKHTNYDEEFKVIKTNEEKEFTEKNNKFKNMEMNLIALLIFSKDLTKHFNKYLGFVQFNNDGKINKVLKTIHFYCTKNLENETTNYKNIIADIVNDNVLDLEEKKYFNLFIKNFIQKEKETIINDYKIMNKGFSLIGDLLIEIYRYRIGQEKDVESLKMREILKKERTEKLDEINLMIKNLSKNFVK